MLMKPVFKQCHLCTNNIKYVDYKDVELLQKFLNSYARIVHRRHSGLCAGHQRELATAVKRARLMALLPFINR